MKSNSQISGNDQIPPSMSGRPWGTPTLSLRKGSGQTLLSRAEGSGFKKNKIKKGNCYNRYCKWSIIPSSGNDHFAISIFTRKKVWLWTCDIFLCLEDL